MLNKELVKYIKDQVKRGYDVYTVRQYLINSGYEKDEVDSAVDSAFRKAIPASAAVLISVFVVVLLFGAGYLTFSFLKPAKAPEAEQPKILEKLPEAGKSASPAQIEFTAGVSCIDNIQNQDETDIDCGGKKCRKCGFGKECNSNSDCKSDYCYNGLCKMQSCFDGIKNQDEADIDCGGICEACRSAKEIAESKGTCYDKVRNQDEESIDCGGACKPCQFPPAGMTGSDVLEQIRTKSLANPEGAEQQCRDVVKAKPSLDECFAILASSTNRSFYCSELMSDYRKDSCYLNFMLAGDFLTTR